jgi:hypothetical protein
MPSEETDEELAPRAPPIGPDSPLGHILGRDRRLYARLWASAYIPGFTEFDLFDDPDPEEREAGEQMFASFVRDMQFEHNGEEYRRVVELPRDHPDKLPWGATIDLEAYALEWRPMSHARVVRELVEYEKRERQAKRAHLRVV